MFKAADVLVCTVSLFEDSVVSAVALPLRLRTFGNHSSALFVALFLLVGYFGLLGFLF
jgi:hypothetical protein